MKNHSLSLRKSCLHLHNRCKDVLQGCKWDKTAPGKSTELCCEIRKASLNLSTYLVSVQIAELLFLYKQQTLRVSLKIKSSLELSFRSMNRLLSTKRKFSILWLEKKSDWYLSTQFCSTFLRHTLPPFLYRPHKANHTCWNGTEVSEDQQIKNICFYQNLSLKFYILPTFQKIVFKELGCNFLWIIYPSTPNN